MQKQLVIAEYNARNLIITEAGLLYNSEAGITIQVNDLTRNAVCPNATFVDRQPNTTPLAGQAQAKVGIAFGDNGEGITSGIKAGLDYCGLNDGSAYLKVKFGSLYDTTHHRGSKKYASCLIRFQHHCLIPINKSD